LHDDETLEVARPARTIHQLKPHSTRLNVQSRSSTCPESEAVMLCSLKGNHRVWQ